MLKPVVESIASILTSTCDLVLQTMSGAQHFDENLRNKDEISEKVTTSDSNMVLELDFVLFDGNGEDDINADRSGAQIVVSEEGRLEVAL